MTTQEQLRMLEINKKILEHEEAIQKMMKDLIKDTSWKIEINTTYTIYT